MDYTMLALGLLLLLTCTIGRVSKDIWSKILFRLIPLCASLVLLINALIEVSVREAKSWSAFIIDVIERHEHLPERLLTASLIVHLKRIEKSTDDIEKELT